MAMELSFTGWLNDIKEFDWGIVLKCAHHIRKQNDRGEWETTGKDYIDVVVDKGQFPEISEDIVPCRITVKGNMKSSYYEKTEADGSKTVVPLTKVWAKEIEVLTKDFVPSAAVEDVPF